ncbi:cobyrinate a,c-diamide synthase [Colibacter massiliensis]|uniref:cobyrinate a,c-diamide synthase n=1 Tax=Colibacter massiliensis TaxID=1852379 RepID=UPI002357F423|nr:cobyrinate a,c-diamide synthase [Colibacter massiliensis]
MARKAVPRLLLTAPASGSGKTTVTCALLRALVKRKCAVCAFKSGPDYIDPMFHSVVTGTRSDNLDLFLFGGHGRGEAVAKRLLCEAGEEKTVAVLEGAMGFYDGLGLSCDYSAYDLARVTQTPVVLVVNGKGAAASIAAVLKGMAGFRADSGIKGFVVNNVRQSVYEHYKALWEKESGLKAYGCLPYMEEAVIASRHLGLVTANEIKDLTNRVDILGQAAEKALDVDGLLSLAESAQPLTYEMQTAPAAKRVHIAVAKDEAFCFYYDAALRLLEHLGADLIPFSPVRDAALPDCDGLYIGGGYPELYARELSGNEAMRKNIAAAIEAGMPCFAECGGFMYLAAAIKYNNTVLPMVGAVPGVVKMTRSLKRFGYETLTARKDNFLCKAGDVLHAHEFHYSETSEDGTAFTVTKEGSRRIWRDLHVEKNLWAGYAHIHFCGAPHVAENLVNACALWRKEEK